MLLDHRRFLEVLRERDPDKMAAETERHIRHAHDLRLPPEPQGTETPIEAPIP
jgi:DNA-binding GntR family transcriptional regulator